MKFLLVICFMIPFLLVEGKAQSNTYDKKYRLFLDKSLSITEGQYKIFSAKEKIILYEIYSNTTYPTIYLENSISGNVIISFEIDTSNKIQNIKIEVGKYKFFNESAIQAI